MSETQSIIVPLKERDLIGAFDFGFSFILTDFQSFFGSFKQTSVDSI